MVAFGSTLSDQLLYFVGRLYKGQVISRLKSQEKHPTRARSLIARHPVLFVIDVCCMYGLRIIGPVLIGVSRLPPTHFVRLNILGAILWATLFVMLSYFSGQAIESFVTGFNKKLSSLMLVALAIVAFVLLRFWWRRYSNLP